MLQALLLVLSGFPGLYDKGGSSSGAENPRFGEGSQGKASTLDPIQP